MGTEYFLRRSSDGGLFELGKLGKCLLLTIWCRGTEFAIPAHDELFALLYEDFTRMGYEPALIREVTRRILAFAQGGSVSFLNDALDELDDSRDDNCDLRVVDSRYPADWVQP